jgi:hypothetical protein
LTQEIVSRFFKRPSRSKGEVKYVLCSLESTSLLSLEHWAFISYNILFSIVVKNGFSNAILITQGYVCDLFTCSHYPKVCNTSSSSNTLSLRFDWLKSHVLQILDTITEIQERHDAVRDIEKKLLELHQVLLFLFQTVY